MEDRLHKKEEGGTYLGVRFAPGVIDEGSPRFRGSNGGKQRIEEREIKVMRKFW